MVSEDNVLFKGVELDEMAMEEKISQKLCILLMKAKNGDHGRTFCTERFEKKEVAAE